MPTNVTPIDADSGNPPTRRKRTKVSNLLDRVSAADAKRLEAMHADTLQLSIDNKMDSAGYSLALRKVSGYLYDAMQMAIVEKPGVGGEHLEAQCARIFQATGTIQTVMQLLNAQYDERDAGEELTPIWSALSLALETLEDVAEQIEPPLMLKQDRVAA
jgi:hypothetical protein